MGRRAGSSRIAGVPDGARAVLARWGTGRRAWTSSLPSTIRRLHSLRVGEPLRANRATAGDLPLGLCPREEAVRRFSIHNQAVDVPMGEAVEITVDAAGTTGHLW